MRRWPRLSAPSLVADGKELSACELETGKGDVSAVASLHEVSQAIGRATVFARKRMQRAREGQVFAQGVVSRIVSRAAWGRD